MTDPIQMPNPIEPVKPAAATPQATPTAAVEAKDFKSILLDSLDEVNRLQTEADRGVQQLLTGETDNVAEVLAAVNKAGVAFDLLMEIRNKLTDAYREIQEMRL
ncbi:MAG: flagellar hook-basal body complex protein FliE [Phycisphaerales bacterium]|nr:MAG: flagellar hook-basal body complex protein FliE [Phycisphaerales bacterium]